VPEKDKPLASTLEVLSFVYPIARKLYPESSSLLVVSGPEYNLIDGGDVDIVDVKVIK
jgi:hypothetical protein